LTFTKINKNYLQANFFKKMKDKVAEVSLKLLLHIAVFYALFIHFHGEESAGGGFQAGAIFSSVFLVYQFIFDDEDYLVKESFSNLLLYIGIMLYFGTGIITMFFGGNFLEFAVLQKIGLSLGASQKIGIFVVEAGVLLVVAMGLLKIGYSFKRIFDNTKPNVDI
jgi:multicomponent Na+:H+ antiporter subunit B